MSNENRHPIKQWFVTFPRFVNYMDCTEGDMKKICSMFPPYTWIYIVCESHSDDATEHKFDAHYHLSMILKKGISKAKLLLWIKNQWPMDWKRIQVQATRSFASALDYMKKESLIYYTEGEGGGKKKMIESKPLKITDEQFVEYQSYGTEKRKILLWKFFFGRENDFLKLFDEWEIQQGVKEGWNLLIDSIKD